MHDNVILNNHKAENFHWTKKFAENQGILIFTNAVKVTIMTEAKQQTAQLTRLAMAPVLTKVLSNHQHGTKYSWDSKFHQ